jgi:hypothetical protein
MNLPDAEGFRRLMSNCGQAGESGALPTSIFDETGFFGIAAFLGTCSFVCRADPGFAGSGCGIRVGFVIVAGRRQHRQPETSVFV